MSRNPGGSRATPRPPEEYILKSLIRGRHWLSQSGQPVAHPVDFMGSSNTTPHQLNFRTDAIPSGVCGRLDAWLGSIGLGCCIGGGRSWLHCWLWSDGRWFCSGVVGRHWRCVRGDWGDVRWSSHHGAVRHHGTAVWRRTAAARRDHRRGQAATGATACSAAAAPTTSANRLTTGIHSMTVAVHRLHAREVFPALFKTGITTDSHASRIAVLVAGVALVAIPAAAARTGTAVTDGGQRRTTRGRGAEIVGITLSLRGCCGESEADRGQGCRNQRGPVSVHVWAPRRLTRPQTQAVGAII